MRVWLASFPRSGNAFLRTVLRAHGVASTTAYPNEPPALTRLLAAGDEAPRFVKTHDLAAAADDAPAIYLVRDGRDAYVSYAHFALRESPDSYPGAAWEDVLAMLVRSREHFGGWSGHVETWRHRRAPTAVLRYEEMLAAPAAVGAALAELGIALPPRSEPLLTPEEIRALDANSFRKGQAGSWRDEMPPPTADLFWRLHGGTMQRLGYRR